MLRIRRNCTDWIDFVYHALQLKFQLSKRGYPAHLVNEAMIRVNLFTQTEALLTSARSKDQKPDEKKLFCITEYNPYAPNLKTLINKLWSMNDRSSSTRALISYSIVFGYRKPRCLSDWLCRSDVRTKLACKAVYPRCTRPHKCLTCPYLEKSGEIISNSTRRKYRTLKKITCRSSNLIYCISCKECGKQYVGQTKHEIKVRLTNHRSSIRNKYETPVARHFVSHGNIKNPPMKVHILQLVSNSVGIDTKNLRDMWEDIWMSRLNTIIPNGMNILD